MSQSNNTVGVRKCCVGGGAAADQVGGGAEGQAADTAFAQNAAINGGLACAKIDGFQRNQIATKLRQAPKVARCGNAAIGGKRMQQHITARAAAGYQVGCGAAVQRADARHGTCCIRPQQIGGA